MTDSFYKVQSDAVLNADRTSVVKGVGEYNAEDVIMKQLRRFKLR